jgi:hypothetical protein
MGHRNVEDPTLVDRPSIFLEASSMMTKAWNGASWQIGFGSTGNEKYVGMFDSDVVLKVGGTIEADKDIYALNGTVKMNSKHDAHEDNDFCNYPGTGWLTASDTFRPFYENVLPNNAESRALRNSSRSKCDAKPDNSKISPTIKQYNWEQLHGVFDHVQIPKVEFSFRIEKDYGTDIDDFAWTESTWMREWTHAAVWGEDVTTQGEYGREKTSPFPGRKHWSKKESFFKYEEQNVDKYGNPLPFDKLTSKGQFKEYTFAQLGKHPE